MSKKNWLLNALSLVIILYCIEKPQTNKNLCHFIVVSTISTFKTNYCVLVLCYWRALSARRALCVVIYANQSDTQVNYLRIAIELFQLVSFTKPLSNN